MREFLSRSREETWQFGHQLGAHLKENSIVCFKGDLAAGKTTLIKGIVAAAADYPEEQVNSPTFVYLNIYEGKKRIFHFDLYRLRGAEEFLSMGFDEMFFAGGICCIEWSERITALLPANCIHINIEHQEETTRKIIVTNETF